MSSMLKRIPHDLINSTWKIEREQCQLELLSPFFFASATIASYCFLCFFSSVGDLAGRLLKFEKIKLAKTYNGSCQNNKNIFKIKYGPIIDSKLRVIYWAITKHPQDNTQENELINH